MKTKIIHLGSLLFATFLVQVVQAQPGSPSVNGANSASEDYQYAETGQLVQLVNDAADLVKQKGEKAFKKFGEPGSRWRQGETYIFVLDVQGKMIVHPDPDMEGKTQIDLKDVNGKRIVRGLIRVATASPAKPEGWYHYEWPAPGGLLPRWKSTFVHLVTAPSGGRYVVGCGVYNDRMERSFVVDMVKNAVAEIDAKGERAFGLFHDPTSAFMAKDAYIFIIDTNGVELVNAGFPNLEGRSILHMKDTQGKELAQDMISIARTNGQGWVDYMWPKPGESVSTLKSAYVSKATVGEKPVIVGCGVYLVDAPKEVAKAKKLTAPELMTLVREGAGLLQTQGENAYAELRTKGSKWFSEDTYLFVRTMDEKMAFHPADPSQEGKDMRDVKDILGRPYGKMFIEAVNSPRGEGWVHYMYPEPGNIFPAWKSTFVKRVTFPSGQQHIVGCGIYNMEMDETFIEDTVNRAAALVTEKGKGAFSELRDKTGPYVFMDTYVFVHDFDGNEVVNPAQPSLQGKNLIKVKDAKGKLILRACIDKASNGGGWVDYYWYKPGDNNPARKHTFVRKVEIESVPYVVGSGYYLRDVEQKPGEVQKTSWNR